jgi:hypothetical protein
MALKFKLKSKDEIPAGLETHYVERDGVWILDADGAADKSKLDEFRSTNVALLKERDDLKKRFEGIDPDEFRRLADEKRRLEEAQQVKAGEVDKVLETRLKTARADWEKQFNTVTTERDALNARLTSIQIDQAVVSEATKRGLRPTAIPDITSRARSTFRLVNGVFLDGRFGRPMLWSEGTQRFPYRVPGATPLSMGQNLAKSLTDLFVDTVTGGGPSLRARSGDRTAWGHSPHRSP